MKDEMTERFERLEAQVAHLEYLCEQLNQVVIDQGKRLARLESETRRVGSSLEGMEMERIRATNPKPPHYQ